MSWDKLPTIKDYMDHANDPESRIKRVAAQRDKYRDGFIAFYTALECGDLDKFMAEFSVENCRIFGTYFADIVKKKMDERKRLIELLEEARVYQDTIYGAWMPVQNAIKACSDIKKTKN